MIGQHLIEELLIDDSGAIEQINGRVMVGIHANGEEFAISIWLRRLDDAAGSGAERQERRFVTVIEPVIRVELQYVIFPIFSRAATLYLCELASSSKIGAAGVLCHCYSSRLPGNRNRVALCVALCVPVCGSVCLCVALSVSVSVCACLWRTGTA